MSLFFPKAFPEIKKIPIEVQHRSDVRVIGKVDTGLHNTDHSVNLRLSENLRLDTNHFQNTRHSLNVGFGDVPSPFRWLLYALTFCVGCFGLVILNYVNLTCYFMGMGIALIASHLYQKVKYGQFLDEQRLVIMVHLKEREKLMLDEMRARMQKLENNLHKSLQKIETDSKNCNELNRVETAVRIAEVQEALEKEHKLAMENVVIELRLMFQSFLGKSALPSLEYD